MAESSDLFTGNTEKDGAIERFLRSSVRWSLHGWWWTGRFIWVGAGVARRFVPVSPILWVFLMLLVVSPRHDCHCKWR